jgi:hypothetical protein
MYVETDVPASCGTRDLELNHGCGFVFALQFPWIILNAIIQWLLVF